MITPVKSSERAKKENRPVKYNQCAQKNDYTGNVIQKSQKKNLPVKYNQRAQKNDCSDKSIRKSQKKEPAGKL